MIVLSPQMRILVAVAPADFRRGIDGLCALCKAELKEDPFSGAVFVFRSRRATAVKILTYDGQGFWLCQKRLSKGRFAHWPRSANGGSEASLQLLAHEVHVLLFGGDPGTARAAPQWRRIATTAGTSDLEARI